MVARATAPVAGVAVLAAWVHAFAQPTPPQRAISPIVHPDRTVTLRILAPNAREVTLSSDTLTGVKVMHLNLPRQPLQRRPDGVWEITIGPLAPDTYTYTFFVDGLRTIDPANPRIKTGTGPTSIFDVPRDTPAFHDFKPVPHGDVRLVQYRSTVGTVRQFAVYTPPAYDADPQARYPVLYLIHGGGDDELAWSSVGHANLIADNLIAEGRATPAVIVMPSLTIYTGAPGAVETSDEIATKNLAVAERELIEAIAPVVEERFRVRTGPESRAIVGLSRGGRISLVVGLNHRDRFAYVGGFSAALLKETLDADFGRALSNPEAVNRELRLLWVGCGTEDLYELERAERFSAVLKSKGVRHVYHTAPGAHTWLVWRGFLREFLPLLFRTGS